MSALRIWWWHLVEFVAVVRELVAVARLNGHPRRVALLVALERATEAIGEERAALEAGERPWFGAVEDA